MLRKSLTTLALAGIFFMPPTVALTAEEDEQELPALSFGAFGTVGIVHSSEDQADFVHSATIPRGAGASDAWAADVDTLLGAQVTAVVTSRISAVVQVVAEHNYDNSYEPHVEWANLQYEVAPGFSVRVGRIALPIFMHTASRKVGFALPWVRTPAEVYELVPVTSNDGVDVTWDVPVGPGVNTFQFAVGRSSAKYSGRTGITYTADTRDQFTAANSYEFGAVLLRANYGQAHLTLDALQTVFDGLRQFGPAGAALADRYEVKGRLARFMGLSASYDPGRWFAAAEWGRLNTYAATGNREGWYLSGGRRIGALTPYVTFSSLALRSESSDPGLDLARLPGPAAPAAAQLNAALNTVLNGPRQENVAAGLRWDLLRNVSFKVQYDHLDLGRDSKGTLSNLQPGFKPGGTVHLLSATVDFVL
jgi:hypothetical protein